jgi:hypothetical protein
MIFQYMTVRKKLRTGHLRRIVMLSMFHNSRRIHYRHKLCLRMKGCNPVRRTHMARCPMQILGVLHCHPYQWRIQQSLCLCPSELMLRLSYNPGQIEDCRH